MLGLIWVQTFCKGYQQTTLVDKELIYFTVWTSSRENLSSGVCGQHRCRPACASQQSDQRLCYWLFGKYHILTCYGRNFSFLASLCSWAGWFESHFVGNPEDRFCRVESHIQPNKYRILVKVHTWFLIMLIICTVQSREFEVLGTRVFFRSIESWNYREVDMKNI